MLHIINKSPHESSTLEECQELLSEGDAVLLIEDTVVSILDGHEANTRIRAMAEIASVYALKEDMRARGIERVISGIQTVDYDGFVRLVEEHDKSISWL